jgi:hypothetical protein
MTININNLDLENVHIDTYQMLTGDSFVESEIDNLREIEKDDALTYDDFDWSYDHKAIVKEFALASIEILENAIDHDAIKSIEYVSSTSPRYYNYTSDSYIMAVEVDVDNIDDYIAANQKELKEIVSDYAVRTANDDNFVYTFTPLSEIKTSDLYYAAICHIINNCITADDYNMAIWEREYEVYSKNTTIKLIKA